MTESQQKRLAHMEKNVQQIIEAQSEFRETQNINGRKLDELLVALKGNSLGDEGLIKRISDLEDKMKDREKDSTINTVYMSIFKGLIWLMVTGIVGFIMYQILNKK